MLFWSTVSSVELFLWVHSKSNINIGQIFDKDTEFEKIKGIEIPNEYIIIKK